MFFAAVSAKEHYRFCIYAEQATECDKFHIAENNRAKYSGPGEQLTDYKYEELCFSDKITNVSLDDLYSGVSRFTNIGNVDFEFKDILKYNSLKLNYTELKSITSKAQSVSTTLKVNTIYTNQTDINNKLTGATFGTTYIIYQANKISTATDFTELFSHLTSICLDRLILEIDEVSNVTADSDEKFQINNVKIEISGPITIRTTSQNITLSAARNIISLKNTIKIIFRDPQYHPYIDVTDSNLQSSTTKLFDIASFYYNSNVTIAGNKEAKSLSFSNFNYVYSTIQNCLCIYDKSDNECPSGKYNIIASVSKEAALTQNEGPAISKIITVIYPTFKNAILDYTWIEDLPQYEVPDECNTLTVNISKSGSGIQFLNLSSNVKVTSIDEIIKVEELYLPEDMNTIEQNFDVDNAYYTYEFSDSIDFSKIHGQVQAESYIQLYIYEHPNEIVCNESEYVQIGSRKIKLNEDIPLAFNIVCENKRIDFHLHKDFTPKQTSLFYFDYNSITIPVVFDDALKDVNVTKPVVALSGMISTILPMIYTDTKAINSINYLSMHEICLYETKEQKDQCNGYKSYNVSSEPIPEIKSNYSIRVTCKVPGDIHIDANNYKSEISLLDTSNSQEVNGNISLINLNTSYNTLVLNVEPLYLYTNHPRSSDGKYHLKVNSLIALPSLFENNPDWVFERKDTSSNTIPNFYLTIYPTANGQYDTIFDQINMTGADTLEFRFNYLSYNLEDVRVEVKQNEYIQINNAKFMIDTISGVNIVVQSMDVNLMGNVYFSQINCTYPDTQYKIYSMATFYIDETFDQYTDPIIDCDFDLITHIGFAKDEEFYPGYTKSAKEKFAKVPYLIVPYKPYDDGVKEEEDDDEGLPGYVIALISIACVIVLGAIIFAAVLFLVCKKTCRRPSDGKSDGGNTAA